MRPLRTLLALTCLASLSSCGGDVDGLAMSIKDPLALIDDVEELRLYVLPADAFSCEPTTGVVSPEVPRLPEGMFMDAVVDVSLGVEGSRAMTTLEVPGGEYVVLVRGTGTDMVTGIPDSVIALACAATTIEPGDTREARLTLIPQVGMGMCGDGILSPDEQCEDGNTADGDGCSATCRTEPFDVNTTTAGVQINPSVAGAVGQRWVATYDSDSMSTLLRFLEPDRSAVTSPGVLAMDSSLADALPSGANFALASSVAVASTGRVAIAFTTFLAGQDVKVGFFDQNRTAEGAPAVVRDGAAPATAGESAIAFAGSGAAMVVFQDSMSATGLSGQVFAAGSATPAAADPFEVGAGTTGGQRPAIAGTADGFVVAFSAGGVAYVQRFGADGAPRDASAQAADGGMMQDQVAVGALSDGRALVAWRQGGGASDGAGTAVAARAFAADGTAAGETFVLNTTTAGDQGSPSVIAIPGAAGEERFGVAFTSGAGIRARVMDADGDPALNFEAPPTTADWEVAASGTAPATAYGGPTGETRWMTVWTDGGNIGGRVFR